MWYFQFCEWLAHPTYDNGFNQKIAYTCGEAWVIRILAIVAVLLIGDNYGNNKDIQKNVG